MARKQKTYSVRDTSTTNMGNGVKRIESVTVSSTSKGFPFKSFLNVQVFIILFVLYMIGSSVTYFMANKDTYLRTKVCDSQGQNCQYYPYETLTGDEALIQYMADRGVPLDNSLDTAIYEGLSLRDIFENDTEGITLPNGIKTFEISGNDLVQKVMKYTLLSGDIFALNTTSFVDVDVVFIKKSIDYITYNSITPNENNTIIPNFIYSFDNIDSLNDVGQFSVRQQLLYYILGVPKGTYANLAAAQTDHTGTIIYYQLATPIVLQTFTTAPSQLQLDEWLDMYLTLKGRGTAPIFDTSVPAWELLDLQTVYDNYDSATFTYKNYYYLEFEDYNVLGLKLNNRFITLTDIFDIFASGIYNTIDWLKTTFSIGTPDSEYETYLSPEFTETSTIHQGSILIYYYVEFEIDLVDYTMYYVSSGTERYIGYYLIEDVYDEWFVPTLYEENKLTYDEAYSYYINYIKVGT